MHLNEDMYAWSIDELYGANEEEFIAEMYLRNQYLRDEYHSGNHVMIDIFTAFKLYQTCQEVVSESS